MKKFIKENWFKISILLILIIALCGIFFINYRKPAEEISKITNTSVKNGNIFIGYENGKEKQITFSGLDDQPSLSTDFKKIVFLRNIPGKVYIDNIISDNKNGLSFPGLADKDENGDSLIFNQIIILDLNNFSEKNIFESGVIKGRYISNGDAFTQIFDIISFIDNPIFSVDNNKIYFNSMAWATSGAIFSIDINTNQLSFVTPGNSLNIITQGKYIGNILVNKHKYFKDANGSYDHYFVVDSSGEEIKDVGDYDKTPEEIMFNLK